MTTVPDKQKAVILSIGLCCIEAVYREEKPQSFPHNKLAAAMTNIAKATDDYLSEAFQGPDMAKAEEIFNVTKKAVDKHFKPPRVKRTATGRTRGQDGRFI
jgi:hypothetical protein